MQGQVQCLYGCHCSPLSFSLDSSTAIVSSSSLDAPCGKNSSAIHKQLQRHKKNKGLRACYPSPSNTVVSKRCLDSKKRALHRWVSLVYGFLPSTAGSAPPSGFFCCQIRLRICQYVRKNLAWCAYFSHHRPGYLNFWLLIPVSGELSSASLQCIFTRASASSIT